MKITEQQIVFSIGQTPTGPALMIGIPAGAWEYMKDGKTNHFDLASIGIPLKLVLFGAENHAGVMKLIEDAAKATGHPLLDQRNKDFSIKAPT